MLGVVLRSALPPQHLNAETKDVVKLGTGLVGTIAALVLGLLIASAKGSYDAQSNELTQLSANIALIDRILAHYGPTPRKRAPRCAVRRSGWWIGSGRKIIQDLPPRPPAQNLPTIKFSNSHRRTTCNVPSKWRR